MNKDQILEAIKHATKLDHVAEGMMKVFETVKAAGPHDKIGYVSGVISSDGDEKISENMDILEKYTVALREKYDFPIFSGTDVFRDTVYSQLEEKEFEREVRREGFVEFWRKILRSGHITDVFMTPRWDESEGAIDEYEVAKELGIRIHNVDESIFEN